MVNKVILVGRVGKDPEVRHLDNNASVARITLATNESYKNKNGEKVTNTEWHNLVAWRSQADFAGKYIKKGTMLYVEGKIHSRAWDDKDGIKHYTTEIDVESFQLLSARHDDSGNSTQSAAGEYGQNVAGTPANTSSGNVEMSGDTPADDLPF